VVWEWIFYEYPEIGVDSERLGLGATRAENSSGGANGTAAPRGVPSVEGTGSKRSPSKRRKRTPNQVFSALDLGTNNCRLLVATPNSRGFAVIDSFSRIVRLGEDLDETGELSKAAMDRAMEALEICAKKIRRRGVKLMRNVATEACRRASNGEVFIERVRAQTGLDLDIISPREEARLAVRGCMPLLDRSRDGAVVFDIGGGSTELVLLDMRDGKDPTIAAWTSLPFGVISLAELYGGRDIPQTIYADMVAHMVSEMESFFTQVVAPYGFDPEKFHFVGTSGTITTVAGIHLGLKRYDRRKVDGSWISMDRVIEIASRLSGMDFDARVAQPCVGWDRADLVIAGCAILEALHSHWPSQDIRVADRGLREGMLLALMESETGDGKPTNGNGLHAPPAHETALARN